MINCVYFPSEDKYLDNRKINKLSKAQLRN